MTTTPEQFLTDYLAVVDTADAEAVKRLYTADARIFDAMSAWEYGPDTWPAHIDHWMSMVRPGGDSSVRDLVAAVAGDLAVLHGTVTYSSTLADGSTGEVTLRLSLALRRTGDEWLISHEHSSFPVTMSEDPRVIGYDGATGPRG